MGRIKGSKNKKHIINFQYFPFSPGLKWKLENDIILPELHGLQFSQALNNKDIVITAWGGLIESYLSLSYIEFLYYIYPNKNIYWLGENKYNDLIKLQGIAKIYNNNDIYEDFVLKYPAPIILGNKFVYFNCLSNYLDIYNIYGQFIKRNIKIPLLQQIFQNCLNAWNINYLPQFRRLHEPKEMQLWKSSGKFNIDKQFLLIFPDIMEYSEHGNSCLGWNINETRSFINMLNQIGLNIVVMTKNINKYHGLNALILNEQNLDVLLYMLKKAKFVMAEEIDLVFLKMMTSNECKIISKSQKNEFNLLSNQKFLGTSCEIIEKEKPEPYDIYLELKGK